MKKFISFVLCLFTAFCFCGCGGSGTSGSSSSNQSSSSGTTSSRRGSLTIAIPMTTEETSIMQAVVDGYRVKNPLVSISIDPAGSSGTYYEWLNSLLSNNDMSKVSADIVRNNMSSQYFGSNKFVDFTQYLKEDNGYAQGQVWEDTLNPISLMPNGSNGEIYSLCFQSTQVSFFYNKEIFEEVGITVDELATWAGFKNALEKIQTHYNGEVIPLGINGSASSFWSGQMSWVFRTYVDQYFRSIADDVHTKQGDWNYDPIKDGEWKYGATAADYPELNEEQAKHAAWFNDEATIYTQNELRLLQGIMDGTYGPDTLKFKNMLANLSEVFPKYCGSAFSSDDSTHFWTGKAAITLDETSLLVQWKNKMEISPETMFEVGSFPFPAMSENDAYKGGAPDVDYTRSIGGPHGYYGIINKSTQQTELAMDFMKFWVSKQGQEIEMAKYKELGIALKGIPYVYDVDVPDEINLVKDMELRGVADFNPAVVFARGLGNEGLSTRDFQSYSQRLFVLKNMTIDSYATAMQNSMKNNMANYLKDRGYRSGALDNGNVTVSPF